MAASMDVLRDGIVPAGVVKSPTLCSTLYLEGVFVV